MENTISFYFLGNENQATEAALKLIPKTAKNREIKIVCSDSGHGHNTPTYRVTVKFVNYHTYAVITNAADIFDNAPTEGETNASKN